MSTEAPLPVSVSAYAGASYPDHPISILWQDKRLDVMKVERSWRTPMALHFRVQLESLGRIELIYYVKNDAWTLIRNLPPLPDIKTA